MSISDDYKIPIDAVANVHSVSAIGEQYFDLVSDGEVDQYFSPGQTITKGTVPGEIGPALDAANSGLAVLPKEKIAGLLDETSQAVGGLGPALQRLVDGTQAIVGDFRTNINDINDIISNSGPIIDSQVNSGDAIAPVGGQPEQHQRADRRAGPGAAQRAAARRAHGGCGERRVQRCPRIVASDAGEPRDRDRHAQALPQRRRADLGAPPAGCVGRAGGGHTVQERCDA